MPMIDHLVSPTDNLHLEYRPDFVHALAGLDFTRDPQRNRIDTKEPSVGIRQRNAADHEIARRREGPALFQQDPWQVT